MPGGVRTVLISIMVSLNSAPFQCDLRKMIQTFTVFPLVDPTLSADQVKALYWASQYSRLSTLKGKYDSQNVFRNPQSIVASS